MKNVMNGYGLELPVVEPWPEPVCGKVLLDDIARWVSRFVILPPWAADTVALWVLHTYAFKLRDVCAYLGIESAVKRCGKTTLLTVLSEVANRVVVSSNISPAAFFRVIEEKQPTLLIDEADTLLPGNDELRGVLNAGYKCKTAYVVRVASNEREPKDGRTDNRRSRLVSYSCWCPKAIAAIGQLPDTLADRYIIVQMQRKSPAQKCERCRNLDATRLKRQCERFVLDHGLAISGANPEIPATLNDRCADIWEPLFALADLAGGDWPQRARQAAMGLARRAAEDNPGVVLVVGYFRGLPNAKRGSAPQPRSGHGTQQVARPSMGCPERGRSERALALEQVASARCPAQTAPHRQKRRQRLHLGGFRSGCPVDVSDV